MGNQMSIYPGQRTYPAGPDHKGMKKVLICNYIEVPEDIDEKCIDGLTMYIDELLEDHASENRVRVWMPGTWEYVKP